MCCYGACHLTEYIKVYHINIDKTDWKGILQSKIWYFEIVLCAILHAYLSGFNVIDGAHIPTDAK